MNAAVKSVKLNLSELTDVLCVSHLGLCTVRSKHEVCASVHMHIFAILVQLCYLYLLTQHKMHVWVTELSRWFKVGLTCLSHETYFWKRRLDKTTQTGLCLLNVKTFKWLFFSCFVLWQCIFSKQSDVSVWSQNTISFISDSGFMAHTSKMCLMFYLGASTIRWRGKSQGCAMLCIVMKHHSQL